MPDASKRGVQESGDVARAFPTRPAAIAPPEVYVGQSALGPRGARVVESRYAHGNSRPAPSGMKLLLHSEGQGRCAATRAAAGRRIGKPLNRNEVGA